MKKNIYLVQVNFVYGEKEKSMYIPCAIGTIAAYAFSDEKVREAYNLGKFIYIREDIDDIIDSFDNPYLVGFSSYAWSIEYNKALAKKIKEKYPACVILFGGHQIKPDASELDENPFIDILVHGEGEAPFKDILLNLEKGDGFDNIANISYRREGLTVSTEKKPACDNSRFPSPFLGGYFDDIINRSDIKFSLIWETNRGCSNRCAYCDWGELKSKTRLFPMERIVAEIDWMVKNKIEYIYCADANFGLFERDEEIVDLILESKAKYGYPQKFKTNFAKNREETVFRLGKKLEENDAGKTPTLSLQSLSPAVLENINRVNLNMDYFNRMMSKYNSVNIHVLTELILGLPGETYDSFLDGMCALPEYGQHKSISVYLCEVLVNSLLGNPDYMKKHGITAQKIPFSQSHCVLDEKNITEYSRVITATNTMPQKDFIESLLFAFYFQSFHDMGLTRAIAVYLFYEKGVSYREFYENLLKYFSELPENELCGREYRFVKEIINGIARGENGVFNLFENWENITWGPEEHIFLTFAIERDYFYDIIKKYIGRYNIDPIILENLIRFQKGVIKQLNEICVEIPFEYDFYNYLEKIYANEYEPLKKTKNRIIFTEKNPAGNWKDYTRYYIWYGRRDDRNLYTGNRGGTEVKFE